MDFVKNCGSISGRPGFVFGFLLLSILITGCGGSSKSDAPIGGGTLTLSGTISGTEKDGATVTLTGPTPSGISSSSLSASAVVLGTTTTDVNGDFSFTGLTSGIYGVSASKSGATFAPISQIGVLGTDDVLNADFTSSTSGATLYSISGVVTGDVVAGVTVTLGGAASGETVTDDAGAYSFGGLVDATAYTVDAATIGATFVNVNTSNNGTLAGADLIDVNFTSTAAGTTYSVSGTVTGDIVPGVLVTLTDTGTGIFLGAKISDGSGNYTFSGIADGNYTLTPSATGYSFAPSTLTPTVSGADVIGQDFVSSAVVISGTVSGDVLAGVTINLTGDATASTTTDGSGNYSFSTVADGSYTVTPVLDGYTFSPTSTSPTIAGASSTTNNFTASAVVISGTVSGDIADGVTINLSGDATTSTVTSGGGNYSFSGIADGNYTVTPVLDGYTFSPTSAAVAISGASSTTNNFTASAVVISGTVSGDVQAGVTINLTGAATDSTVTDGSGNFSFSPAINGSYTVTPVLDGYTFSPTSTSPTIAGASSTTNNFTASAVVISGTVSGAIQAGVTINLTGAATDSTVTDGSGNFSFSPAINGSYTVTPVLDGYTFSPTSTSPTIAGASSTTNNFTASAVVISGTVSGDVLAGVTINLTGAMTTSTVTDGSGNYSFSPAINGSYTVTPSLAGYTFSPTSISPSISGASSTGNNFTATAVFTISGTVTGDSPTGVTIDLSGDATASTATDGSGNYSFANLPAGSYTVTPSNAGHVFSPTSQPVTITTADVSGVDFVSAAVYSISGTVTGSVTTGVLINLSGDSSASTTTDGSGNYSFTNLPNGSYTVAASFASTVFTPPTIGVVISGADQTGQDFSAAAGTTYSISGVVSGDIADGVTMTLSGYSSAVTTTSGGGNYSFANLESTQSYTVTPSLLGYTFAPTSITENPLAADNTTANFVATQVTYTISGTITGDVTAGVTVDLSGDATASTATDGGGNYSFSGLFDGNYTVTPSQSGYTFTPTSHAVAVSGADVPNKDFVSALVTAAISGTVTGVEVNNIQMDLTGSATDTVFTDANGDYSFTGLANGNYTVTPSPGCCGPSVEFTPADSGNIPLSGTDVTGVDFVSREEANDITGSLTYAGSQRGWIYISVFEAGGGGGNTPIGGTVIDGQSSAPSNTPFTIQNVRSHCCSNYEVTAYIDIVGGGMQNLGSASGTTAPFIHSGGASAVGLITLTDPSPPVTPVGIGADIAVAPGNNGNIVFWDGPFDMGTDLEIAEWYNVYICQTPCADPVPTGINGGIQVPANDDSVYLDKDAVNGTTYKYMVTAVAGGTESAASDVITQTAGPVAGGITMSGTATATGFTPTGPLYVVAFQESGGPPVIRFTRIASPSTSQAYTVTGLTVGTWELFSFYDMDDSGTFTIGDVEGDELVWPVFVDFFFNPDATDPNFFAEVTTEHQKDISANESYQINTRIEEGVKRPVAVTLTDGPAYIKTPRDIGKGYDHEAWFWLSGWRPNAGSDSFTFEITYSDGTTDPSVIRSVTGVLDSFPTGLSPNDTSGTANDFTPTFSWTAPAAPPAGGYTYRLSIWPSGCCPGGGWWRDDISSLQTSIGYNDDFEADDPQSLGDNSQYNWWLSVVDIFGNSASQEAQYTP